MKKQTYQNHVQYYPPHHFVFYPLLLIAIIASGWQIFSQPDRSCEWIAITAILFFIGWLSFMLRQHYALGNQNRIVRLEMRLRYYQLTQQRFDPLEQQLSFSQIAALRFASDAELPALVQRTIQEKLSSPAIKKAIQHWQGDYMRV